jgi:hypothetical protein
MNFRRITTGLALIALLAVGSSNCSKKEAKPIDTAEIVGFDHLESKGYKLRLVQVPTRGGEVKYIERTANVDSVAILDSTQISYIGDFHISSLKKGSFFDLEPDLIKYTTLGTLIFERTE